MDHLIDLKSKRREQPDAVRALLRVGLYQLFWLDRVPEHAAVNETVGLANRFGASRQRGFLNAVLRGYTRERAGTRNLLVELETQNPEIAFSHPDWLVKDWIDQFGQDDTRELLRWNNQPAKTFARVNTLQISAAELKSRWESEGVEFHPASASSVPDDLYFELRSGPPPAGLDTFKEGCFYIQDPSTALACGMVDPQPGEEILDFCAAPGGKTTFLAQLAHDRAEIVAHDRHANRLKRVQSNCERLGVKSVTNFVSDARSIEDRLFDKILIDAPCSNTGVMRRRVDLRWRISREEIVRLAKTQIDLIKEAANHLKPNGKLIYSTCSIEHAENEAVIETTTKQGLRAEKTVSSKPFRDQIDGAFAAVFTR